MGSRLGVKKMARLVAVILLWLEMLARWWRRKDRFPNLLKDGEEEEEESTWSKLQGTAGGGNFLRNWLRKDVAGDISLKSLSKVPIFFLLYKELLHFI